MALVTAMVMVTAMANKEAGVTKVKVDAVYRACTIQLDGPMCKQLSALINIDGCVDIFTTQHTCCSCYIYLCYQLLSH